MKLARKALSRLPLLCEEKAKIKVRRSWKKVHLEAGPRTIVKDIVVKKRLSGFQLFLGKKEKRWHKTEEKEVVLKESVDVIVEPGFEHTILDQQGKELTLHIGCGGSVFGREWELGRWTMFDIDEVWQAYQTLTDGDDIKDEMGIMVMKKSKDEGSGTYFIKAEADCGVKDFLSDEDFLQQHVPHWNRACLAFQKKGKTWTPYHLFPNSPTPQFPIIPMIPIIAIIPVILLLSLVPRLAGRPVGRLAGRPVGRLAGWPVGRLAGRLVGRLAGRPVGRSAGRPAFFNTPNYYYYNNIPFRDPQWVYPPHIYYDI